MSTKNFKLKKHFMPTSDEHKFIARFNSDADKNTLVTAFVEGVSIEEMEALGIGKDNELSRKAQAALFARYRYKWSHAVAKRIMEQSFDDEQLDTVMRVLLRPTMGISEDKLLKEILFDSNSMEDMLIWLNKQLRK